jgi:hypothetical protein
VETLFDETGEYRPQYCKIVTNDHGHAKREQLIPEGCQEIDVPAKELMTFKEWVKAEGYEFVEFGAEPDTTDKELHKYRYATLDEQGDIAKIIRRSNPNAKWDWYVVGGRWTGYFTLKEGTNGDLGRPGTFGNQAKPRTADVIRKQDIDIEKMRNDAQLEAETAWDTIRGIVSDMAGFKSWQELREELADDMEKVREIYHEQVQLKLLEQARKDGIKLSPFLDLEDYNCSRDDYITRARNGALASFAFVRDSKWYECGDMGWWGIVSDEKDPTEWANEFNKMFDDLPGDTLLTLVDCHI